MTDKSLKYSYEPLAEDIRVDVAIIGGGLSGISAAYFLSKAGQSVALLEADTIGSGATSKTTAIITHVLDTDLQDLISMVGPLKARLAWQSHADAIDTIEEIVKAEKIECNFRRCPNYYYANSADDFSKLEEEYEAINKLGFEATISSNGTELPFTNSGYLKIPNQAKFYVSQYLPGLASAAVRQGAQIYEYSRVINMETNGSVRLDINRGHSVVAKKVIIATYQPFTNPFSVFLKKGMYVSYILELEIPKNSLPEAVYEDTDNPYNYWRIDPGEITDTMFIGGQDHRQEIKIDPKKNYRVMEAYVKKTFPNLQYKVCNRWSGPILEPADGLALIGDVGQNRLVSTAFSGNGMTYSTISGFLLCDLILKRRSPYIKLYDPKRIPGLKSLFHKGMDYSQELIRAVGKVSRQ